MISNHSVQFIDEQNKNISFDFKQLDISCYIDKTVDSSNKERYYILNTDDISGEFQSTPKTLPKSESSSDESNTTTSDPTIYVEKTAHLYIPIDKFQNTFKMNIKQNQALKDNYQQSRFYVDHDNWSKDDFIIPFQYAYVKNEDAEAFYTTNRSNQTLENDIVRYIIIKTVGAISAAGLMTNVGDIKETVGQTVQNTNDQIKDVFTNNGGNKDNPIGYEINEKNFSKDFLVHMLESTVNMFRKKVMISNLSTQINAYYEIHKEHKFFITGTSFKGYGNYFPIYINKNHSDLFIGCTEIKFDEIEDMVFYMNPLTLNNNLQNMNIPASYYSYDFNLDDYFMNVPFFYGDSFNFSMKLNPSTDTNEITPLKYNINMIMSLDSHVIIDISDSSIQRSQEYLSFNNEEHQYNIPILSLHYQDNEYYSPYSYYPYLGDISDIIFDVSINQTFNPINIEFTCRPMNNGTKHIFTFNINPNKIQYDGFLEYSIVDFQIYHNDVYYDYESLINISVPEEISQYVHQPKIKKYGDLQIMKIGLSGSGVKCYLKKMILIMKDKKKIEIKI